MLSKTIVPSPKKYPKAQSKQFTDNLLVCPAVK